MRREAATSPSEVLALHAVRLKGMADDADVAARFGLDPAVASEHLLDFQAVGWITRVAFPGTAAWTLTAAGRTANERQLAEELYATDTAPAISDIYRAFLPNNARLLRACTDWQLRPNPADPLAANDHADPRWDGRVLGELAALSEELTTLCRHLAGCLTRFRGYDDRFSAALQRANQGQHAWVNRPRADSCHTVWMELHEDLLATLGIPRGSEPAS